MITEILSDWGVTLIFKDKFYRMTIRPTLLYGLECLSFRKDHSRNIRVAKNANALMDEWAYIEG